MCELHRFLEERLIHACSEGSPTVSSGVSFSRGLSSINRAVTSSQKKTTKETFVSGSPDLRRLHSKFCADISGELLTGLKENRLVENDMFTDYTNGAGEWRTVKDNEDADPITQTVWTR